MRNRSPSSCEEATSCDAAAARASSLRRQSATANRVISHSSACSRASKSSAIRQALNPIPAPSIISDGSDTGHSRMPRRRIVVPVKEGDHPVPGSREGSRYPSRDRTLPIHSMPQSPGPESDHRFRDDCRIQRRSNTGRAECQRRAPWFAVGYPSRMWADGFSGFLCEAEAPPDRREHRRKQATAHHQDVDAGDRPR